MPAIPLTLFDGNICRQLGCFGVRWWRRALATPAPVTNAATAALVRPQPSAQLQNATLVSSSARHPVRTYTPSTEKPAAQALLPSELRPCGREPVARAVRASDTCSVTDVPDMRERYKQALAEVAEMKRVLAERARNVAELEQRLMRQVEEGARDSRAPRRHRTPEPTESDLARAVAAAEAEKALATAEREKLEERERNIRRVERELAGLRMELERQWRRATGAAPSRPAPGEAQPEKKRPEADPPPPTPLPTPPPEPEVEPAATAARRRTTRRR